MYTLEFQVHTADSIIITHFYLGFVSIIMLRAMVRIPDKTYANDEFVNYILLKAHSIIYF